jgi:hypothetical protein
VSHQQQLATQFFEMQFETHHFFVFGLFNSSCKLVTVVTFRWLSDPLRKRMGHILAGRCVGSFSKFGLGNFLAYFWLAHCCQT